jgi:mannosyltransferase OCH1-like enzyme
MRSYALTLCPRRCASWKSQDKAAVDNLKEEHAEALRTHAEALRELFFYFIFIFFLEGASQAGE